MVDPLECFFNHADKFYLLVRDLAVFNLFLCFVHFICKFYLLALSEEAVSVREPAVAAAVHPVFVCGVSWGMMLLRCFFPIFFIFLQYILFLVRF